MILYQKRTARNVLLFKKLDLENNKNASDSSRVWSTDSSILLDCIKTSFIYCTSEKYQARSFCCCVPLLEEEIMHFYAEIVNLSQLKASIYFYKSKFIKELYFLFHINEKISFIVSSKNDVCQFLQRQLFVQC